MRTTPIRRFGQVPVVQETSPYLLLTVLGVHYAVPLLGVREVAEVADLVQNPDVPAVHEVLMGTQVLRGQRIPVVDMGVVLEQRALTPTRTSCLLVVRAGAPGTGTLVGLAVDGVSGLTGLAASDLAAPPQFGPLGGTDVVSALASTDQGLVSVLDPGRILASRDVREAVAVWRSASHAAEPMVAG